MSRQELLLKLFQKPNKNDQSLNSHFANKTQHQVRPATIKCLQISPIKSKENNTSNLILEYSRETRFEKKSNANNRRIMILQKIKNDSEINHMSRFKAIRDEQKEKPKAINDEQAFLEEDDKVSLENFKTEASSPIKSPVENKKPLSNTAIKISQNKSENLNKNSETINILTMDKIETPRKNYIKFQNKINSMKEVKVGDSSFFANAKSEKKRNKITLRKETSKSIKRLFEPPPKITAKSYVVYQFEENASVKKGKSEIKIHTSLNSKIKVEIASLTKIMTCIVAIEICTNLNIFPQDEKIRIGKFESNINGTSAQIQPGEIYSLHDLLHGLMLPSGNDASLAIAVWGGKKLIEKKTIQNEKELNEKKVMKTEYYEQFIKEMNLKVEVLGMEKTNYANSHGLSNFLNRSCAHDIAVLSNYCMKNEYFCQIVGTKEYKTTIKVETRMTNFKKIEIFKHKISENSECNNNYYENYNLNEKEKSSESTQNQSEERIVIKYKEVCWENTHKLLHKNSQEYVGIKTGVTTSAGPCLSTYIRAPEGSCFLIVVLNCKKLNLRFKETEILKRWVYRKLGIKKGSCEESERQMESDREEQNGLEENDE